MIHGKEYQLRRLDLYDGGIIPIPLKLKSGFTLGWNIGKRFVSYRQIKKSILSKRNQKITNFNT